MPANPMKGEAEFGEHKLIVNFNRLCALEAATELKVGELLRELQAKGGAGFLTTRTVVRVFLDKEMGTEEVGDLIGELGLEAALKAIGKALDGFFAPLAEKQARPPKAG